MKKKEQLVAVVGMTDFLRTIDDVGVSMEVSSLCRF
jgi:hypothetical protein